MPVKKDSLATGKNSNAKIIPIRVYEEEGIDQIYMLSERQSAVLLRLAEYLNWINRYEHIPDDLVDKDDRDKWVDQTKDRLINPMAICELIIDCIETDEDTRETFRNFIASYNNSMDNNPVGKPLPSERSMSSLIGTSNPDCDHNILWAQCKQLVQTTNGIVLDLLEAFEGITNIVEATATALGSVPAIGDTIAAIPNYINLVQEFIAENYAADYTITPVTGYEDVTAMLIFCACENDCIITIDRIFDVFLKRVVDRYETAQPIISILNDLCSYLVGLDVGGTQVADQAFLLVWGGLKLANFIVGGLLNRPFIGDGVVKVWLELAVNDANDDWLLMGGCVDEDCPIYNFPSSNGSPAVYAEVLSGATQSQYSGGTGWTTIHRDIYRNQLNIPLNEACSQILLQWTQTGVMDFHGIGWRNDTGNQFQLIQEFTSTNVSGTHSETIDIDYSEKPVWANAIMIYLSSTANLSSVWVKAQYF